MDDFSKLDVWALGVMLINMLTLEYPFINPMENEEELRKYEEFMSDPMDFFNKQNVVFRSSQEASDVCELVQGMLQINMKDRISLKQVLDSNFLQQFKRYKDTNGIEFKELSQKSVRKMMVKR